MKLQDAARFLQEVDHEDEKRPPPVKGSGTISTSQAARILGVVVSRVRQFIRDKILKSTKPQKGDRDHEILKKDVDDLVVKRGKKSGKGLDKQGDKAKAKAKEEKEAKKKKNVKEYAELLDIFQTYLNESSPEYINESLLNESTQDYDEFMSLFGDLLREYDDSDFDALEDFLDSIDERNED